MTWAARYSRTETPEITIYRDGVEFDHVHIERARRSLRNGPCDCGQENYSTWGIEVAHPADLRADIAARVPVTECTETQACTHWAMPDGRCHHVHGGRDEL